MCSTLPSPVALQDAVRRVCSEENPSDMEVLYRTEQCPVAAPEGSLRVVVLDGSFNPVGITIEFVLPPPLTSTHTF